MILAQNDESVRRAFEWDNAPEGWPALLALLALLAIGYAVIWLYRREGREGAGPALRLVLAGLRCAVVGALAVIWLDPVIATYNVRTIHARVAVVTDVSTSMSVSDPLQSAAGGTRLERVEELYSAGNHAWLRRLAENNQLALYAFGEETAALAAPWESGAGGLAAAPVGRGRSDAALAVAHAFEDRSEQPMAAVILVSDGQFNKGAAAEDIAAHARRFKSPIYAIGVGAAVEPPNLRVVEIAAPPTAPTGDPFQIRVQAAASGIDSASAEIELTVQAAQEAAAAGEPPAVVARRSVTLTPDAPQTVDFEVTPGPPGSYVYRVRIEPLADEPVLLDNARDAGVEVLDQRLRVLLVTGGPSYEYRYLTRMLERDRSVDVSCWLQSADVQAVRDGDVVIRELPRRPEEVFGYDAIILLDPNPEEFDQALALTLRRFVDEFGGGLLVQAGPHHSARFMRDARLADLVAILPITPDPEADVRLTEQGTFRTRAVAIEPAEQNRTHPLVSLASDAAGNREVWRALPGVSWHLPVLKPKPIATVLLETPGGGGEPECLMAVQPVGAGRTAFLGFNTTWRWRGTAERCFNQFWVQVVRYLSQARREAVSKRGTISLDRATIFVGDYVTVEARVLDPQYNPWHEPQVEATLKSGDAAERATLLSAIPGREGWFAGRVLFDHEGSTLIRVKLPGGEGRPENSADERPEAGPAALTKRVLVQQPDYELRALRMREDVLRELALQTGGEFFTLDDAGGLPSLIKKASQTLRTPGPKLAQWDRGWVLAVLAGLLAVEWWVRRRNHLL
ncbi:hypothetical protein RAS1_20860 [Phycisphaerae bacterium RAS1]|nr:hypothetical protein RAS1_20860 [Phycisphaerae bacterium RAS1]